jgi:hypothetical protein
MLIYARYGENKSIGSGSGAAITRETQGYQSPILPVTLNLTTDFKEI